MEGSAEDLCNLQGFFLMDRQLAKRKNRKVARLIFIGKTLVMKSFGALIAVSPSVKQFRMVVQSNYFYAHNRHYNLLSSQISLQTPIILGYAP